MVEPMRGLTGTQRRQVDEEVELVGNVMGAKPKLVMGTVTEGHTPDGSDGWVPSRGELLALPASADPRQSVSPVGRRPDLVSARSVAVGDLDLSKT
jgi:hypothetical protein